MGHCDIVACIDCSDHAGQCRRCARSFDLSEDGRRCVLVAEEVITFAVEFLLVILSVIIVCGFVCRVMFMMKAHGHVHHPGCGHEHQSSKEKQKQLKEKLLTTETWNYNQKVKNLQAIKVGFAHWWLSRLMDWSDLDVEADPAADPSKLEQALEQASEALEQVVTHQEVPHFPRPLPIRTPVHTKFIVGVGLPVFYNFHMLPAVAAVLAGLAADAAARFSGVRGAIASGDERELAETLRNYAEWLRSCLGLLWLGLLVVSLLHCRAQRLWRVHFDRTNSTPEDYTLHLDGVPPDITSEAEIEDMVEKFTGIKPIGVSIGYDLSDDNLRDKVFWMNERLLVQLDSTLDCDSSIRRKGLVNVGYDPELVDPHDREHKRPAQRDCRESGSDAAVFRGEVLPKLRGSGKAWVVYRSKVELDFVRQAIKGFWMDRPVEATDADEVKARGAVGRILNAEGDAPRLRRAIVDPAEVRSGHKMKVKHLVHASHSSMEPPSIMWMNLGTKQADMVRRFWKTILVTLAVFVLLLLLVFYPLGKYLLEPYAAIHAGPGFVTQQLQGFIFGLANNILGITMWINAWGIGFFSRDNFDSFVLVFGVLVSYFNTGFFLHFGLQLELPGFQATPLAAEEDSRMARHHRLDEAFRQERTLCDALYNTLVPGWLFAGFLIGQVMGNIWPMIQNWLLLQVVFVCDCLPFRINQVLTMLIPWNPQPDPEHGKSRLTARQAELVFSPKELALAWDYGSYIVIPTVCFSTLFMLSPENWRVFPVMLFWVVFMYAFHRFVTLRISKKQMHASEKLTTIAEVLWGVPLSIVAAAWSFWGARLGHSGWIDIPITFVASLLVYWLLMFSQGAYGKHHCYGESEEDYFRMVKRMRFSWFNCNPVHVLKSNYCPEAFGGSHIKAEVPFCFGKEYMFLKPNCEGPVQVRRGETGMPLTGRQGPGEACGEAPQPASSTGEGSAPPPTIATQEASFPLTGTLGTVAGQARLAPAGPMGAQGGQPAEQSSLAPARTFGNPSSLTLFAGIPAPASSLGVRTVQVVPQVSPAPVSPPAGQSRAIGATAASRPAVGRAGEVAAAAPEQAAAVGAQVRQPAPQAPVAPPNAMGTQSG